MKLALDNVSGDAFTLNEEIIDALIQGSHASTRKRMLLPLHRRQEDAVQRMLNCIQPGSYIRPHLHPRQQGVETACVLRGEFICFLFDAEGNVRFTSRIKAGTPQCVFDIEARLWHAFWALEPDSIILEIKGGPYDAKADKIFAEWAPDENSPESTAYMERLMREYVL